MEITIPDPSLVLLLGVSGSGKSTFARQHFAPTEIVSSDHCRALVCDDENDQSVNQAAFEILHLIAAKRLAQGKLAVIDATNVQAAARQQLLVLAAAARLPAVAIVFKFDIEICLQHNAKRLHRVVPPEIILQQQQALLESLASLAGEGFQSVYVLTATAEMATTTILRKNER